MPSSGRDAPSSVLGFLPEKKRSKKWGVSTRDIKFSLEQLPDESLWLRSGQVEKLVVSVGTSWQYRKAVLTEEVFAFVREDTNDIIDFFRLDHMQKITRASHAHAHSHVHHATVPEESKDEGGSHAKIKKMGVAQSSQEMLSYAQVADKLYTDFQDCVFTIFMKHEGHHHGRSISMRCATVEEADSWVATVGAAVKKYKKSHKDTFQETWRLKQTIEMIYKSNWFQYFVYLVIVASFCAYVAEAEYQPDDDSRTQRIMATIQLSCTIVFTVELAMNIITFSDLGVREWFSSSWNVFDLIVVTVSIISEIADNIPSINLLRLFRIVRVIRLFGFMKSLNRIVNAISASVIPVVQAFIIFGIVTFIYAAIAVKLFGQDHPEYFGYFSASLFTFFQMSTAEGWSDIVRGMWTSTDRLNNSDHALSWFFVSYMFVCAIFLLNIVVAVMLDEFLGTVQREKLEKRRQDEERMNRECPDMCGNLDPLMDMLCYFRTPQDLTSRIQSLYTKLDTDASRSLDFWEMKIGLLKLNLDEEINLSVDDWETLTHGHSFCDEDGGITPDAFETIIRVQLEQYVYRRIMRGMQHASEGEMDLLLVLKVLLSNEDNLHQYITGRSAVDNPDSDDEEANGSRQGVERAKSKDSLIKDRIVHANDLNFGRLPSSAKREPSSDVRPSSGPVMQINGGTSPFGRLESRFAQGKKKTLMTDATEALHVGDVMGLLHEINYKLSKVDGHVSEMKADIQDLKLEQAELKHQAPQDSQPLNSQDPQLLSSQAPQELRGHGARGLGGQGAQGVGNQGAQRLWSNGPERPESQGAQGLRRQGAHGLGSQGGKGLSSHGANGPATLSTLNSSNLKPLDTFQVRSQEISNDGVHVSLGFMVADPPMPSTHGGQGAREPGGHGAEGLKGNDYSAYPSLQVESPKGQQPSDPETLSSQSTNPNATGYLANSPRQLPGDSGGVVSQGIIAPEGVENLGDQANGQGSNIQRAHWVEAPKPVQHTSMNADRLGSTRIRYSPSPSTVRHNHESSRVAATPPSNLGTPGTPWHPMAHPGTLEDTHPAIHFEGRALEAPGYAPWNSPDASRELPQFSKRSGGPA